LPEKLQDALRTGLATREEVEAKPYGFRVTWIKWDSGFRGTDIRIGDRIVGIDGKRYDAADRKDHDKAPGGYAEDQYWEEQGAKDRRKTMLTVWRDGESLDVSGEVRADRYYTTNDGRRAIAAEGPVAMDRDGFDDAWMGWLEKFEQRVSNILDGGWRRSLNMRVELADALEEGARVEFLMKTYPGPFARATKADFDALIESLRGKKYDLTPADLAYRSLTAHRVDEAVAAGSAARDSFLEKAGAVPLESLPAIDPIRGDRQSITGKVVVIPKTELISQAGHGWYWASGAGGTVYLIDSESPVLTGIYLAVERFKQLVAPDVNDVHSFIGRVTGMPTMVATGRTVYTGVVVDVVADTVDGKVFVDASSSTGQPRFANEEKMLRPPVVETGAGQTPEGVMGSFFNALKLGDQDLWASFFASWSCEEEDGGRFVYDPEGGPVPNSLNGLYVHARKMIMSTVYDVRVARVDKARTVLEKPKVEQVTAELDHVGLFDGEYRAFRDAEVNRIWHLQRVDGAPWRITSEQGI
jgi:hypothetical protein